MGTHKISTKKSQKEADTQFLVPFPTRFDDSFPCPWGVPMWTGEPSSCPLVHQIQVRIKWEIWKQTMAVVNEMSVSSVE